MISSIVARSRVSGGYSEVIASTDSRRRGGKREREGEGSRSITFLEYFLHFVGRTPTIIGPRFSPPPKGSQCSKFRARLTQASLSPVPPPPLPPLTLLPVPRAGKSRRPLSLSRTRRRLVVTSARGNKSTPAITDIFVLSPTIRGCRT